MNKHAVIASNSPARTTLLGELLGRALESGDVVVLDGDLGAGKTTFTQGIARGMGITDQVTSPTFVVAREMPAGPSGIGLLHVDAYRISTVYEWDDLDMDLESRVTVIEWGERVEAALPFDRLHVVISGEDDRRDMSITAQGSRATQLLAAMQVAQ